MNTLSATVRVLAAIAAVTVTLSLIEGVFAIAEPQRGVLIAKIERAEQPRPTRLATVSATTAGFPIAK